MCAASPILYSLLPLVGGILLAVPDFVHPLVPVASAGGILLLSRYLRHPALSSLSLLLGFMLARGESASPDPEWRSLPAREVRISLQVEETFNARKPGSVSGIGKITHAPALVRSILHAPTAFYLDGGPLGERKPFIGETIECRAVLEYLTPTPDQTGYQAYLLRRHVYLSLNRGAILRQEAPAPKRERLRQSLFAKSQSILSTGCEDPSDPGHVLASMLLGDRSRLSDERIDLYRRTGSYHLFAVSGLHVGSVALCLFLLTRTLRLPRLAQVIPVLLGTWAYVWLTGASPSAVRAGIMITCVAVARVVLRQPHLFPSLILSAWIVLLLSPSQLFHLGFQLSYGVVASIILVGLPLAQKLRWRIEELRERHPPRSPWGRATWKAVQGLSDLACVSTSAGLASTPLIIQHFALFTPGGILMGILLNPLATLSVMAGCVALLVGHFLTAVPAGWVAMACWPVIEGMEFLLQLCLRTPGAVSTRNWLWPGAGTIVLLVYLALAWWLQKRRMRGRGLSSLTYGLPLAFVMAALLMTVGEA